MKILAVDTSTKHLSLALTDDNKSLAVMNLRPKKDLSLSITLDIERLFKKANVFLKDIDGFVIGQGPGSFTSLRVGFSMMKAFIMVTEKPVVGVPSLDAIAMNVRSKKNARICVIVDARRNLLYSCLYEKKDTELTRWSEYLLKPLADIFHALEGEIIFTGDGVSLYRDVIIETSKASNGRFTAFFENEKHWLPQARELAHLGARRLLKGDFDKIETLAPMYLYPEDCQISKK
ncbi:MAG: tRNA (adenosine(37)-N6)-threonylcarbamoyltransferase complex dimerization subunit type 1 TsaB [Candidatus Omnitrophica bacterium]|nr:tRNA (adenosine(37)-N6)-threonylcarbamoyltransferase complex dimerization subunit type 1 TsaB [Candidatus Omnitrophota bacterium]